MKTIFLVGTLSIFSFMVSAEEKIAPLASVVINKADTLQVFQGSDKNFTGIVQVKLFTPSSDDINASSASVTFSKGARTFWHTHPYGQYIIITNGKGFIQEWGQAKQLVSEGDVVWFPPHVKHWHGATADTAMTHYVVTGTGKEGHNVDWLEAVSEEQYQGKE